jgi:hypothetical protein
MIYLGTQLLPLICSCFFVVVVKFKAKDYNRITSILFYSASHKSTTSTNLHASDICQLRISVTTGAHSSQFHVLAMLF